MYLKKLDCAVCPSEFIFTKMKKMAGNAFKGEVIPNFVETETEISTCEGGGVFIGRLAKEKGIDILVEVLKRNPLPFTFIGDGPMLDWTKDQLSGFNQVEFTGWLESDQIRKKLIGMGYLVAPSLFYDNQPLSVLQGMAAGLPLIVSDSGGLPELVKNGENGYLVRAGDVEDLYQKMVSLSSADSDKRQGMGRISRNRVENEFSAQAHQERLISLYHKLTGTRGRFQK